jgi:hypothetical protein
MEAQETPRDDHRDDVEDFVAACPAERANGELQEVNRDRDGICRTHTGRRQAGRLKSVAPNS